MKTDTDLQNKKTMQTLTQKNTARPRYFKKCNHVGNTFPENKLKLQLNLRKLPTEISQSRDAIDDAANDAFARL